ncbi:hypothetical protein GCM10007304_32590 [Rhodococcoides trifolii]|uniref:GGDEF domain-containing protein n=1 Tax=Rhodococcoides trifolii TaxID=908250 RepID=A0A917FZY5_9NOCA|nr:GGDEF domain-containing protein [Rhodococcus trifolii]GGG15993.1 hypothetical protein GCM10007304_32590 [Rhodococcus trifolii]
MDGLRQWWNDTVDYDWLMRYHRAHPFLRHAEKFVSVYAVFYTALCLGLLVDADLVRGAVEHAVVASCAVIAGLMSVFAASRRVDSLRSSLAFVASGDIGTAAVLLCLIPSPLAVLATTIFTGIGNYAASFHGARVLAAHYCLVLLTLGTIVFRAAIDGSFSLTTVLVAAGAAGVVLFTSSVIVQALVSYLRRDAAGAYFDPLTGLRNRRGLLDAMSSLFHEQNRAASSIWCVVIDLDGFKSINDRFGHDHGDTVLRRTAARIEHACPSTAFSARVGGEEFTVVGSGSEEIGLDCADRIMTTVFDDEDDTPVTASLGLAVSPAGLLPTDGGHALTVLSSRADAAMYEAKRRGGHQVVHSENVDTDRHGTR